ncbi:transposase [Paenibacillus sp. GCM10027626]|uniref:transposase n=1 Tax=Paenibacillus sp. GCM10027626 TaxID=3273411 RepID=UPI003634F0F9
MSVLIILGSILVPLLMAYWHKRWSPIRHAFNVASLIMGLVFGNIAAISVYRIIRDQTVFMTKIHGIFINPFFLAAGAYLGVYILYRLLMFTMKAYKEDR